MTTKRAGAAWRIVACAAALPALSGCGWVLGIDYATGCEQGQVRFGDACKRVDACAEDKVPIVGGGCEAVGVEDCGKIGDEVAGGCQLYLGEESCPPGQASSLASDACAPVGTCPGPMSPSPWVWVDKENVPQLHVWAAGQVPVPTGEDGPYPSISAALAAHPGEAVTLLLHEGEYVDPAPLVIDQRVQIAGVCPSKTVLRAADPTKPAVTLAAGAEGSNLHWIGVTGGSDGVRIEGGGDVRLYGVHVYDNTGAGVAFEDAPVPSTLEWLLVENTSEGVRVRGSTVELLEVATKWTTGPGIAVYPSRFAGSDEGGAWRPDLSVRSSVELDGVLVDGARDAGILVEGSDATLRSVIVRNVEPGMTSRARGIAAEWRPTGEVPATLDVSSSAVLGAFDVGIDVWNADASLRSVEVAGQGSDGCLGHGIRARKDALPDAATTPSLLVSKVLVRDVRHTGVGVEGTTARIERSILRDVDRAACESKAGYGASVEPYAFRDAELVVSKSRIDRAASIGAVSFGGTLRVEGALVTCSDRGIVTDDATSEALCGCDRFAACSRDDTPAASPLTGVSGCKPDGGPCFSFCGANLLWGTHCEDILVREVGHDASRPVHAGASGIAQLDGAFQIGAAAQMLITVPGFLPRIQTLRVGAGDLDMTGMPAVASEELCSGDLFPYGVVELFAGVLGGEMDLSRGVLQIHVCEPPFARDPECGFDAGFDALCGAHITDRVVSLDGARTLYWTGTTPSETPNNTGDRVTIHGIVPGLRRLLIDFPAGSKHECRLDMGQTGWQGAVDLARVSGTTDSWWVDVPVAAGVFNASVYVICGVDR